MQGTTDRHTYIFGESVMRVEIELDDYSKEKGVQLKWEEGTHIHLDEHNSLEEGSMDLIIEKME